MATQGDPGPKYFEGLRRLRMGEYEAAVDAFTDAIAIDGNHALSHKYRAEALESIRLGVVPRRGHPRGAIESFFDLLESQGVRPQWGECKTPAPQDTWDNDAARFQVRTIVCSDGPIRLIAFEDAVQYSPPTSDYEEKEFYRTHTITFDVPHSWRTNSLRIFTLERYFGGRWVGNDMGLGIIERLNADSSLRISRHLTIKGDQSSFAISYSRGSRHQGVRDFCFRKEIPSV